MQGVVVSSQITRAEFALALKASSRAARKDEQRRLLLIPLACLCAVLASTPVQEMSLSLYMAEESREKEIKYCRNNPSQVLSAGESEDSFSLQKRGFCSVGCTQMCVSCIWDATGTPSAESSKTELCRT